MAQRWTRDGRWLVCGLVVLGAVLGSAHAAETRTSARAAVRKPSAARPIAPPVPASEPAQAAITTAELGRRLAEAARAPGAVFVVPGTDWTLRVASVAVGTANGEVVVSLVPSPNVGTIQIRGRPVLVGRNAWRADRLQVFVDTPLFAASLADWIRQQIRGGEPRTLDTIFGPSAAFTGGSERAPAPPRVLALGPGIQAGRIEPQALYVDAGAIRLAALLVEGTAAPR